MCVCVCADGRTDGRCPPETAAATPRHLSARQWGLIEIKYRRIDLRPNSLEPLGVERDSERRRRDAKHILCLSAVVSSQRLDIVVVVVVGPAMYTRSLHLQFSYAKQRNSSKRQHSLRCVLAADTRFLISVTLFYWASAKNI